MKIKKLNEEIVEYNKVQRLNLKLSNNNSVVATVFETYDAKNLSTTVDWELVDGTLTDEERDEVDEYIENLDHDDKTRKFEDDDGNEHGKRARYLRLCEQVCATADEFKNDEHELESVMLKNAFTVFMEQLTEDDQKRILEKLDKEVDIE